VDLQSDCQDMFHLHCLHCFQPFSFARARRSASSVFLLACVNNRTKCKSWPSEQYIMSYMCRCQKSCPAALYLICPGKRSTLHGCRLVPSESQDELPFLSSQARWICNMVLTYHLHTNSADLSFCTCHPCMSQATATQAQLCMAC